ncbi:MAG: LysE family translocator [Candidatus Eremiobacteraeota bacterium]|nr:LysE family translocator [Candidatus Eremiobacteraeota bacterium]
MVAPATLLAFLALEFVLCLIPGPAVLLVTGHALRGGARGGFVAALGIVLGNTIYFVLSALGLAAVIHSSAALFVALKFVGAAYLAFLGIRALFAREMTQETPPAAGTFVAGVVTQLANPKAIVFFGALLPQFIDVHRPFLLQIVALGIASQLVEAIVLCSYSLAAGWSRRTLQRGSLALTLERVGGAFLLGVALRVALLRS